MKSNKKTENKGLQRFTNYKQKSAHLWALKQVTLDDMKILTSEQEELFLAEVNSKQIDSKGVERDKLLKKFEPIFSEQTHRDMWHYNHAQITQAITNLMQEYGRMPLKSDIAERTGLSRPTIDKHLKEYQNNTEYLKNSEQFRFMSDKVLAKVFSFAVNGDIRACKLYLECMGKLGTNNSTTVNTQNNYIQINGLTISQDQITQLPKAQLNQIQNILTQKDNRIIEVKLPAKEKTKVILKE